jgi:hypothetical protein
MDHHEKRSTMRFVPPETETSFISLNLAKFQNEMNTLIINESAGGACLILNVQIIDMKATLEVGQLILVKVGDLTPVSASVRWVKRLDCDVMKIGIEYCD